MTNAVPAGTTIRAAGPADLRAMIAIAKATGQEEDWTGVFPDYIRHLMAHGSLLVAERAAAVTGYGGTLRVGAGRAVSMLTDLFVDPAAHGSGAGRALLGALWSDAGPRMTFSSLHANALPLYTSFGVDAWWPLLYLRGDVRQLDTPPGWSVAATAPESVAGLERQWTGADRTADHRFWAGWPDGVCVVASLDGRPSAAGTVGGAGQEFGICHLASDPAVSPGVAADGVVAVLSWLRPAGGLARVCLPAPHRATRALLRSGWRVEEFDLHMASDPGLIDPYRLVPSAALA
ncbi:MAG TPA: GNAT family N-acetyltransferase [Streptosporangiaceae bacterium]|nr:GNAT family N-acetyltransferase [Streptosporangiaceae bacterium]